MLKVIDGIKYIEQPEWKEIGTRLYGAEPKKWKFQCPNCKNAQSAEDFKALIDAKVVSDDFEIHRVVNFSCIGRYDKRIKKLGTIMTGDSIKPCDYTLGGLFNFVKLRVYVDDKKFIDTFDFADDWSGMFDSEGNYIKP